MDGSDGDEFGRWYRQYWPHLVGAVTVAVGDADVATDSSAEALSRLWARSATNEVREPEGWCYRTAVNVARRTLRRRSMEASLLRRGRSVDSYTAPELSPELWRAVQALPNRQREVIALRYVADLTQAQIAVWLDISPGSAASALHDARAALRRALQPLDPPDRIRHHDLEDSTDG